MGLLRYFGIFIIVISVIGFLTALYYASVLSSGLIAVAAVFSLLGGIYAGYLGIAVDELQEGGYSRISSYPAISTEKLEDRVKSIEALLADQLAEQGSSLEEARRRVEEKGRLYIERPCAWCGTYMTIKREEIDIEPHICPVCNKKQPVGYFHISKK
jgi:hypothetical protein